METLDSLVKDLEKIGYEGGATSIKRIKPQDVVVAQWVRSKCQTGCRQYGKRFHCPPYSPTPEETRQVLQDYSEALLIEFANLERDKLREAKGPPMIHTTLYNMERAAFLKGYQKALVYEAGPCVLCKKCPAEELEHLTLSDKKLCKHPKEARPAMEAAGIDVYSTIRRAGFDIHVVADRSEPFKVFGLLLLE